MGSTGILMLTLAGLIAAQDAGLRTAGDRMYGRVTTTAGDVVEGYLRWDRNEGSWADALNGYRELPQANREEAERLGAASVQDRRRSVDFQGVRVSWDEEQIWPDDAEAALRFGHIRRLRVLGDDEAEVELKRGEPIRLTGGSTDLGIELRGLGVERPTGEVVELSWSDLDVVDFFAPPPGPTPSGATRLHGTVTDRRGNRFTGYVAWDVDEILTTDVLDGEVDGERREIPFADIQTVERIGTRSVRVVLDDGRELLLRGTNDVNNANRGIQISDPGLGQVLLGWRTFASVRFHPPERPTLYDDFDGGRLLRGTVFTEDGVEYQGRIRWDNDEEWSWQVLDGRHQGVDYDVEFGQVARIVRSSPEGVEVTLRDGRVLALGQTNDVSRDNKGIFVTAEDGSAVVVEWGAFRELVLEGG